MPGHDSEWTAEYVSPSAPVTPPPVPDTLAPTEAGASPDGIIAPAGYELLDQIGQGGMGVVYRARDLSLNRDVAVKILAPKYKPDSAVGRRFVAEARITGQLQHPGIPAVHQVGTLPDGRPFLAMKLIKGQTLDALVRDGAEDLGRLLAVFEQVAQAVGYAHAHRVIHRDLKPANVMVGAFGEVQVMDWGLAKVLTSASWERERPQDSDEPLVTEIQSARDADSETQAGSMLGTPAFMPPEQAIGAVDQVDERSDVFGLGAILCTILTDQPPYAGGDAESTRQMAARAKLEDALARLAGCGAEPDLVAVARRCLSAEPADRPANAGEVARAVADLRAAAEQRARRAELERERAEVRATEQRKRRRVLMIAVIFLLVVLTAGIAGTTVGMFRADKARKDAEVAEGRETEQRQMAEAQRDRAAAARDRTRRVLDEMTSAATGDALEKQPTLSEEQKSFLTGVLSYYQEFAGEAADDENSRRRTAAAAYRVGAIEFRLGRNEESGVAFRRARDAFAALAADFPAAAEYRASLAHSHSRLGLLLTRFGKCPEAEEEIRAAIGLLAQLVADFPLNADYIHQEISVHGNLGILLALVGRRPEAEAEYRAALALQENLTASDPGNAEYRSELGNTHNSLANLLASFGKSSAAEAEYDAALALQEKLVVDSPDVPTYRAELARSQHNLALLQKGLGKWPEAEANYRSAIGLQGKLAADFPAVPDYRAELAHSHDNLGYLLARIGRRPEAETEYHAALALQEKLAADYPAIPDYRVNLAHIYNNLGILLVALDRRAEAETKYRTALSLRERLVADFPKVPTYQIDLAGSCCNFGNLVRDRDGPAASLEWYGRAIAVLSPLVEAEPDLANAQLFLRNAHVGRAKAYDRLARPTPAIADWDRAVTLSLPDDRWGFRAPRVVSRIRAGQVAEAVAEVAELSQESFWTANQWYDFACVYSLASAKDADKRGEYAARAVELLQNAVAKGYGNTDHIAKDTDIDPIRQRPDFQKLLADLRTK